MSRQLLLGGLLVVAICGCEEAILHDLEESQANAVLAALQAEGIAARKRRRSRGARASYTLEVPRSAAGRAWRLLRQRNLPRPRPAGLGEVFGKSSLVPTAQQQQALLRHALAGELTRTLQALPGVRQARVHVVLPPRDPLAPRDRPPPQPRAAVFLELAGGAPVAAADVRRLVAGAVDGMALRSVRVVISGRRRARPRAAHRHVAEVVAVGPFDVAIGSRAPLLATLVAAVLLLLGLAMALLWSRRRGRRASRRDTLMTALSRASGSEDDRTR